MISFKQFIAEADENDPNDPAFIKRLQDEVNRETRGEADLEVEKHWNGHLELYMIDTDHDPDDPDESNAFSVTLELTDGDTLSIDSGNDDAVVDLVDGSVMRTTNRIARELRKMWDRYVDMIREMGHGQGVANRSIIQTRLQNELEKIGNEKARSINFNGTVDVSEINPRRKNKPFIAVNVVLRKNNITDLGAMVDDDDPAAAAVHAKLAKRRGTQKSIEEARPLIFDAIIDHLEGQYSEVETRPDPAGSGTLRLRLFK